MKRKISRGRYLQAALTAIALVACSSAQAAFNWQSGHITGVTYIDDYILVAFSAGPPDNCAGSPSGWMMIESTKKSMQAYVTGLWLRGDASQVPIYIYTDAPTASGAYCTVKQVNPQS